MVNIINIVTIIQFTVLSTVILLTLIYSFSLVLLQRFRHRLHIFTINVCASILCCSIYWLTNYVMIQTNVVQYYYIKTCSLVYYAQTMCTLQVVLAMIVVSIHRLCYVVYHNNIFLKSKKWTLMCVVCQWFVGMVMSLPAFIRSGPVRKVFFSSEFNISLIDLCYGILDAVLYTSNYHSDSDINLYGNEYYHFQICSIINSTNPASTSSSINTSS
jgi:hypothetical protein